MGVNKMWAQIGDTGRRIPVLSLTGSTPEETGAVRDRAYLSELDRQAEIFCLLFERASTRAVAADTPADDATVWALIQGALFAAIVVDRLINEHRVPSQPDGNEDDGHAEARRVARKRAKRIRRRLGMTSPDSAIFRVAHVRDSFEHVDERLDLLMRRNAIGIADWYISDGWVFSTPNNTAQEDPVEPTGYSLRMFHPASGSLWFGGAQLDLYGIDLAMVELRSKIAKADEELDRTTPNRHTFGGWSTKRMDSGDRPDARAEWLEARARLGRPVQTDGA